MQTERIARSRAESEKTASPRSDSGTFAKHSLYGGGADEGHEMDTGLGTVKHAHAAV